MLIIQIIFHDDYSFYLKRRDGIIYFCLVDQAIAWTSSRNVRWSVGTAVLTMTLHNAILFSCSLKSASKKKHYLKSLKLIWAFSNVVRELQNYIHSWRTCTLNALISLMLRNINDWVHREGLAWAYPGQKPHLDLQVWRAGQLGD